MRSWFTGAAAVLALLVVCGCNDPQDPRPDEVGGTTAVSATPVAARPPAHPFTRRHIYGDVSAAPGDIAAGLKLARSSHKRVLLDFGGDWCGDCQVLDIYFHDPENLPLLEQNFVLVHVNVGRIDQNLDIGERYGVNLKKGVPALAVLSPAGRPLYGQSGEFSDMRYMESSSVHEFLTRWKAQ
jgi:thiol-disulfide isomerase/thioredoxin